MPRKLIALLITAALVVGGLAGIQDEPSSDQDEPSSETKAVNSPDRYCQLSSRVDRATGTAYRKLMKTPGTTRRDVRRTEAALVREHDEEIDALVSSAPAEIAEEVELLVASLRAGSGSGQAPPTSETQAAESAVTQFERENCGPVADRDQATLNEK